MDVGNNKRRRGHYGVPSVESEGQRERSTELAGKWPPEKMNSNLHISQNNINIWVLKHGVLKRLYNSKILRVMGLY